ncbi:MAG: bifunctional (p)ppGpp synthetase/guanosine-3',5'-bis(diphosphate) 3'-pyrophosphohydrolase [Fimbriimonadales bacterium]
MSAVDPAYLSDTHWEEPEGLSSLLEAFLAVRPEADVSRIRRAYRFAEWAHQGQCRESGEKYIEHPLAVARILADLHMDDDTIVSALLHDTVEDSAINVNKVTPADIEREFGPTVRMLVEGVTKLGKDYLAGLSPRKRQQTEVTRSGESLRKMLLAMAKDFRVMVIKLADRLHNMQTLEGLKKAEKRTRIASETLEVYAPLAARLGIWQIKWQLEDLAFKHLHPEEFRQISELVAKSRAQREKEVNDAIVLLKERLLTRGLRDVEVTGRPKHLYSIFNKMVRQGVRFEEIYDLLAIRVIVQSRDDCYIALGVVHDLWMPVPGLFYDYIAKPKPNGYQSLHTKIVGPHGDPLEVQIRTREMHEIAEFGVAAHWAYKEGHFSPEETARLGKLREQLVDWSMENRGGSEFMRSLSTDLFSEQVFVFTPNGDVIDLPKDSTPVDVAFRVHTEIGLTTVGARVNGILVPLNTKLQNGDVVEIITRSNAQPSLDWIEFVRSAHARSKLRSFFRKLNRSQDASRGRDLLERELKSLGLEPRDYLGEERLEDLAKEYDGCENSTDLLAKIGAGLLSVHSAVNKLRGTAAEAPRVDQIQTTKTKEGKVVLATGGVDHVMLRRGRCCDPIPGDDVVGYISRGRGIVIHRGSCPNVMHFQEAEPDRLMPLDWPPTGDVFGVMLRIVAVNRPGLLMDVSTIFGESKTNVSGARVRTNSNNTAELEITIDVTGTEHLSSMINRVSQCPDVISVLRAMGRTNVK